MDEIQSGVNRDRRKIGGEKVERERAYEFLGGDWKVDEGRNESLLGYLILGIYIYV